MSKTEQLYKSILEAFKAQELYAHRMGFIQKNLKVSKKRLDFAATCYSLRLDDPNDRKDFWGTHEENIKTSNMKFFLSTFHTYTFFHQYPRMSLVAIKALIVGDIIDVAYRDLPEPVRYVVVVRLVLHGDLELIKLSTWGTRSAQIESLNLDRIVKVGKADLSAWI